MEKKQQTKYKPGMKFVVELAEKYNREGGWKNERPETLWRLRHFDSLMMTEEALRRLEPYKEKGFSEEKVEEIINVAMKCFDDLVEMVEAKVKENIYDQDWNDADIDALADVAWMTKTVDNVREKFMLQLGIEEADECEDCEEDEE